MTSVQIAHNWCAIVIRHRCQYTLEAIVVYYIHHHDVSTEKVNAVALTTTLSFRNTPTPSNVFTRIERIRRRHIIQTNSFV